MSGRDAGPAGEAPQGVLGAAEMAGIGGRIGWPGGIGNVRGPGWVGSMMLVLIARAACLLGAGIVLGLAINAARADGVRFGAFAAPSACTVTGAPAAASAET